MSGQAKRKMTLGMIVGNRGFFPDHLARTGHQEMKAALEAAGVEFIPADDEKGPGLRLKHKARGKRLKRAGRRG